MTQTAFRTRVPDNEPVREYRPDAPETVALRERLRSMAAETAEIPCIVGGEEVFTGVVQENCAPHDHSQVLCKWHAATPEVIERAVTCARAAWREWSETPLHVRTAIFAKAADLLCGPWRDTVNAATMLNQSKTCFQADIDAACELADFWRFNNYFATEQVIAEQPPHSPRGQRNHVDHRPLEGFVFAVTPFNFTSIAGNLPGSPVLMGNVCIWKPSRLTVFSNYQVMKVYEEAGMPPGVINFLPGNSSEIGRALLDSPDFAGIHFTGSTAVFQAIWRTIAESLPRYRGYPRIVGETGGKDFIFVHQSADLAAVATAAVRGAFEYQGQKCSAASRMYVPRCCWSELRERIVADMRSIRMGDPTDFSNFMAAVIDEQAFTDITGHIDYARHNSGGSIIQGGESSRDPGWFVQPTLIECEDPQFRTMQEEIFGPVLSVHVYDEDRLDDALTLCDRTSPYALTGAVFARDRLAAERISTTLRHAAGNFYINDKPTGAVVGQQPFGGARASGTDDKAGSVLNLLRWVAPRTVKETFDPPTDYRYPHMG